MDSQNQINYYHISSIISFSQSKVKIPGATGCWQAWKCENKPRKLQWNYRAIYITNKVHNHWTDNELTKHTYISICLEKMINAQREEERGKNKNQSSKVISIKLAYTIEVWKKFIYLCIHLHIVSFMCCKAQCRWLDYVCLLSSLFFHGVRSFSWLNVMTFSLK